MAPEKEYLESLGLEIAKKKYYNAAKVDSVIDEFRRRSAQLLAENTSLHERLDALSYGREEIGDAILSAKTIAQHLLAEAQEKADALLADAQARAEAALAEAKEKAAAVAAEAEERRQSVYAACDEREQEAIGRVRGCYVHLREQYLSSIRALDGEWQRFLCSLGDAEEADETLPEDLGEKLGAIAAGLDAIDDEGGDE